MIQGCSIRPVNRVRIYQTTIPKMSFDIPDFDEMEDATNGQADDDEPLRLNPGGEFAGKLLAIEPNYGSYQTGRLLVDFGDDEVEWIWSNNEANKAIERGQLNEGDVFRMRKLEETDTFENDDGEIVEFHPVLVRVA